MHCFNKSKYFLFILIVITFLSSAHISCAQESVILFDTTYYLPNAWDLNSNLLIAASKGYPSEIHRLIKMGADINTTSLENATPLVYAVANNKTQTVEIILGYEPDTDVFTSSYETALHIAAKLGYIEIAELLIRNNADVDITDNYGATPLHYASIYGDFYMADILLYYGADPELKTVEGTTALMASVWNGFADISDLLIQNGSEINNADNEGFTPLLLAAQNNDTLLADLLLQNGADINATNIHRYDALAIAVRNGDQETIEFFLRRGKNEYINNRNAINPYAAAREYGRIHAVSILENWGFKKSEGFSIDQVALSVYYKGLSHDSYFGSSISFIEPLYNLYLNLGFDSKPGYTRVLVMQNESLYYQYFDQRYIIWGGLGKKIKLSENYLKGDFSLQINLNTGYMFGKVYKGTYIKPDDKIVIMPGLFLKWSRNRIDAWAGYEYMKTGLYKNGPHWFKIGTSFRFYFKDQRSPLKVINWY